MEFSIAKLATGTGIGLISGAINILLIVRESYAEQKGQGCMNGAFAFYITGLMGAPMALATGEETGAGITLGHEVALHLGIAILSHFADKNNS